MRVFLFLLVLIGGAIGTGYYYLNYVVAEVPVVYRTVAIERGDIVKTISATGTLQAEDVIDVGAQVAGRIECFGPDPNNPGKTVDFNSVVKKGMLLAQIDDTPYRAQVEQAEAALQSAKANLLQLEAVLARAKQEWERAEKLRPSQAIADTDYDAALANYRVAVANVEVGKAAIREAEARLSIAKTNLGYTRIVSPVDGTILARRVNIGQTVVASLNAPSIFLIAKDLRRMQVWASVNEADIGQIKVGMPVTFTVDTFPGETFHGTVTQIRMNAQMTQNVVTYTVIVTTDNSSLRLFPYLTTNVLFEVERHDNVLKVPNAALRWKPNKKQIAPDFVASAEDLTASKSTEEHKDDSEATHRRLWRPNGKYVEPIDVSVGITDGSMTEVSGNNIEAGMRVVIGEGTTEDKTDTASETTNPFLPKLPRGRRPPPPG